MVGRLLLVLGMALGGAPSAPIGTAAADQALVTRTLSLPSKEGSVRFAVMGDTGRGEREQLEVASQMAAFHQRFPFDFVIMLGDNIYGPDAPADMRAKFEVPYKALLDAGVEFHASLGNHDNPNQRFYRLFNMGGERYYSFREPKGAVGVGEASVRFFALDSNYLDERQLDWLDQQLEGCDAAWRIAFFHHPLYSSGRKHGSALESRAVLEPLFVKHGVSAVFSGHDHLYERIKPQKGGIVYWVSGAGGSLRKGAGQTSELTAKEFDADYHFIIVEIAGDALYFQAISRTGETIDAGVVHRPGAPPAEASQAPSPAPVPVDVPVVSPAGRSTPEGEKEASPSPAPPPPVVSSLTPRGSGSCEQWRHA
jgi:3',5'-cyclic AMP phosphodiesterase CpdA